MKIETKYNIGDKLYCIWDNEIYYGEVKEISYKPYLTNLEWDKEVFDIHYTFEIEEFGYYFAVREKDVFTSKGYAEAMLK